MWRLFPSTAVVCGWREYCNVPYEPHGATILVEYRSESGASYVEYLRWRESGMFLLRVDLGNRTFLIAW